MSTYSKDCRACKAEKDALQAQTKTYNKTLAEFNKKIEAAVWELQNQKATFEHEWMKNKDRAKTAAFGDKLAESTAHFSEGYSKGIKHTLEKLEPILQILSQEESSEEKKP